MTLQQIDTRLTLFKDYLKYRTDNWGMLPFGKLHYFKQTGTLLYGELMSFNQYLYQHGHNDLIDYQHESLNFKK